MTRELLLLRHGKSDWDNDLEDFYRPLKDRGKRSAQQIGAWLQENDRVPDFVLSSPAVRAIETTRKCVKAMGLTVQQIHEDPRIYEAGVEQLCRVLADCPAEPRRLMMVGHNPGYEELLAWLVGDELAMPSDGKLMPTGTLARLAMPDDWGNLQPGCADLRELIRPRGLPTQFPFPGPDGTEYRDRPAYYYTQSAVIPYRHREGNLEILLVTSSGKRHWVVPKGIHEPGLSAQDSAAKEALEEAGVLKGKVSKKPLGEYRLAKWGGECTVTVFAMEVKKVLPDEEWKQDNRRRQWVVPSKAAGFLKQPELAELVLRLASQVG
jgi:phosphohistidine phosphatase